jgi:hypothetical protein
MERMEKGERELGSPDTPPLRLGVWLRLLGASVRYDGGHKKDAFVTDTLGPYVAWVYGALFVQALAVRATRRKHVNVLQRISGFFKRELPPDEKQDLGEVIEGYGRGLVPLVAPLTLVKHHVRRLGVADVADQVYLNPHSKELMLRNHSEPAKLASAPRRGDATLVAAARRSGALSRYPARPSAAGTLLAPFREP